MKIDLKSRRVQVRNALFFVVPFICTGAVVVFLIGQFGSCVFLKSIDYQATWRSDCLVDARFSTETARTLSSAKEIILYTLDPGENNFSKPGKTLTGPSTFHGFRILGKLSLTGEKALRAAGALEEVVASEEKERQFVWHFPSYSRCMCEAQLGWTVKIGSDNYDFLVCGCGDLYMMHDGEETEYKANLASLGIPYEMLAEAHIPRSPPPKH